MILYLDTSSLVKLYVEEEHSDLVKKYVEEAEIVATSRIAHPETISALTRRYNSGELSKKTYDMLLAAFIKEWKRFVAIDFDEIEAGQMVKRHGLRGFDAIHLSAANLLRSQGNDITPFFSSFDVKLNNAAVSEGFKVMPY
ncbi:MAG: type II toxin-antitoxin system VapC family toxin [Deltaproteobacteria bacterium]|nr:type II toxin-antitoxin system VapC family toxin [Deltaproteobacteria bacterium]